MKVSIQPLYDRILAKRSEAQTHTSEAGLFIPEVARERPQEAVVVAVGCGRPSDVPIIEMGPVDNGSSDYRTFFRTPIVKPGDRVLIGKYSGAEVVVSGETFLILREDEILAIVNVEADPVPDNVEEIR